MALGRDLPHIQILAGQWRTRENYTSHRSGGGESNAPGEPPSGRSAHGALLKEAILLAEQEAWERRAAAKIEVEGAVSGLYLEFESFPGLELALQSMEKRRAKDARRHIELICVTERFEYEGDPPELTRHQYAKVFVPEGQIKHFLSQIEKYMETPPQEQKQKHERYHENIYDRVARIRLAALRELWTDDKDIYPTDGNPIWWEVWLRKTDGLEFERILDYAAQAEVRVADRRIEFDDRIVTLVYASVQSLSASLDVLGDMAELQRAKETATFFVEEPPADQAAWVEDMVQRIALAGSDAPAVCLLDTGINAGHPLLADSLQPEDCHACHPTWGVGDHEGHGTAMAGIALYQDLVKCIEGTAQVVLRHRLESVKILPPTGKNVPGLYGAITAEAVIRPEIQAPKRQRVFSMAVTAVDDRDRGQPTSWSVAVDALAAGRTFDLDDKGLKYSDDGGCANRLFIVSAGNVGNGSVLELDHLSRSDVEPVHDPAQAWNALTVGAFTDKVVISDPEWSGWSPVAQKGDLSPWSTTSVVFEPGWPIKPEVVFEGGNAVHDGKQVSFPCDDLCLLTTHYKLTEKLLASTGATSAASAQAAHFCATVFAEYPDLWPETIRALVVHSAEWTAPMQKQLAQAGKSKNQRIKIVRRYGFGVPNIERALRSAASAVTLIAQDVIHPFKKGRMNEIHFYDLPWPTEALEALENTKVRVHVTLSYFVEPCPGRRGWQRKYRYQSHGLRFALREPGESINKFRKRLNKNALKEEEKRPTSDTDSANWYLGPNAWKSGSIQSDTLEEYASDVARRGGIAIYPVTGWWKERTTRDRSAHGARYALVVSIETDEVEADVWTPIAAQVGIPVGTEVES